ncbi:hypothetical protein BTA51_04990 [Hahella sp. CCB-MM4]|uniref:anti-sigma factor n=1 Tax=Hahella sp. (strain CCB-MM4) TaxID=1926491 RepID=UPI000B9B6DFC|nr:anti-sigma factor [Hahella sp. CCB-MM4]OZG74370.1 hypothetical protein BTA51_04990 [Hahella sp. CCB-MM4]
MPGSLRYEEPELQDRLASSYVVGTMRGKARSRFEKIMGERPDIAKRVRQWEDKMQPLHEATKPLSPQKRTWSRITAAINHTSDQVIEKLLSKLRFYKYLSAAALSIALVIGVVSVSTVITSPAVVSPTGINYVAVLEDTNAQAIMVATLKKTDRLLSFDILKKPQVPDNTTLQLWAVSREDGSTASLGVLELKGHVEKNLTKPEWALIKNAEHLIVSIESAGGSSNGLPSTQLVAKGLCVKVQDWQSKAG